MNYPSFLNETDRYAEECDVQQLRAIIHEIARTTPEERRESFLSVLKHFSDAPEKEEPSVGLTEDLAEMKKRIVDAIDSIRSIIDGERSLDSDYNEMWDDWYNEAEDEFLFSDPEHILDDIRSAMYLLHTCVDRELYQDGADLAEILSALQVNVIGEFDDYGGLDYSDLIHYGLLDLDDHGLVTEAAFLTCMGTAPEERADRILDVLHNFSATAITLQDILQTGTEEINLSEFLPRWIDALSRRRTSYDEKLLLEAQSMLQDDESVLANAKRLAETHPLLYVSFFDDHRRDADHDKMLQLGLDAMQEIPILLSERSRVALLTAEHALELQDQATAEECWMEAFRSDPTPVNYLRLRLNTECWEDFAEDIRKVYKGMSGRTSSSSLGSGVQNLAFPVILFLDGEIAQVVRRFMNAGKGIGWSSTFMKQGLALLLLLLDRDDMDGTAMRVMQNKAMEAVAFASREYRLGMVPNATENMTEPENGEEMVAQKMRDIAMFREMFMQWKEQCIQLTEAEEEGLLRKVDQWIALRVEAIMNANRRNYYGECAEYIAALGEVLESRDKKCSRTSILQKYKARYPRRRAFHAELKRFGLK